MSFPFFTIGHSDRPIDEFASLLAGAGIRWVVDVRTVPRSRANPQYNIDALPAILRETGVAYEHIAALGGLRHRAPDVAADVNAFWRNARFHNYADYALSENFVAGMARLSEIGHLTRCAVMCAEAVWWRCHRRIIADYLLDAGETVCHIFGRQRVQRAQMTPAAMRGPVGRLIYPGARGERVIAR